MSLLLLALLRVLRLAPARALPIAGLTAAAIAIYGGAYAGMTQLSETTERFYSEQALYDLRASFPAHQGADLPSPDAIVNATPGVLAAAWRFDVVSRMRLAEDQAAKPAQIFAMSAASPPAVSVPRIMEGEGLLASDPSGVLLDYTFALRNQVHPGDALSLDLPGAEVKVHVRGLAVMPEFLIPVLPGGMHMPFAGLMGAVVVPQELFTLLLGSPATNELVVRLAPEADKGAISAALTSELGAAGLSAVRVSSSDDAPSVAWNRGRLKAQRDFLPALVVVFLGLLLLTQTLFVARMAATGRHQLGTLQALGFNRRQIITRWLSAMAMAPVLGAGVGFLGALGMAWVVVKAYVDGTGFPLAQVPLRFGAMWAAAGIAALGVALGVVLPLWRVVRGAPAALLVPAMDTARPSWAIRMLALLDARVLSVLPIGFPARLGLRNALRRPEIFFSACGAASAAMVLAASLIVFSHQIWDYNNRYLDGEHWNLAADLATPRDHAQIQDLLGKDVQVWDGARTLAGTARSDHGSRSITVLATPDHLHSTDLIEGRAPTGPGEASIDQRLAEALGLRLGDRLTLVVDKREAPFALVGLSNNLEIDQALIVPAALPALVEDPELMNRVFVVTDDPNALQIRLDQDLHVEAVVDKAPVALALQAMIRPFVDLLAFAALIASAVGGGVVVALVLLEVLERVPEHALLDTLGYTARDIGRAVAAEVAGLAFIAAALALPFVWGTCVFFQQRLASAAVWVPIPFAPGFWLLAMMPTAALMLATVVPALRQARRIKATDALRAR